MNKTCNSNLFFWYFPAASNVDEAPVLLWLQGNLLTSLRVFCFFLFCSVLIVSYIFRIIGGPGATSMFGLFAENGPFTITAELHLMPRKYSWHLNHHLIYIDNPVGTGFSFTDSEDGYATNEDDVGLNLLTALQQFFLLFPHLQTHSFYLSGESYGGKYVPAIGYAIHKDNSQRLDDDPARPKINLRGMAIGNGYTDPVHQSDYADYLYQIGLIDGIGRDVFAKVQQRGIDLMEQGDFDGAFDVFEGVTGENGLFQNWTGFDMYYNYLQAHAPDTSVLGDFLQKSDTRRAIHVGNVSFVDENLAVEIKLKSDVMRSVANWVSELLSHYPIVVYNGQLDIICAYPMTENYLKHLEFDGAGAYKVAQRMIWRVDNEIAGYVKHAGNLTEVLVRNAG